jgi:hypothetical protein
MTESKKEYYNQLAQEKLALLQDELLFFESMQVDATVKADARLHVEMIEIQQSNIIRIVQDIEGLQSFIHWLHP